MVKLGWSAAVDSSLWASWFSFRYNRGRSLWHPSNTVHGSTIWKKIRAKSHVLQSNSTWSVGNGDLIALWYDKWLGSQPLSEMFPLIQFSKSDTVSSIISNAEWAIPSSLPDNLHGFLLRATGSLPLSLPQAQDSLSWNNESGKPSFQEIWNLVRTPGTLVRWSSFIWNKFINPRLACLSWRLMHRSTPTDEWSKRKGWSFPSRCYLCFSAEESDLHIFFSCNLSRHLWCWLFSLCSVSSPSSFSAATIWASLSHQCSVSELKCAAAIFLHTIFVLWQLRNDSKHSNLVPSKQRAEVSLLHQLKRIAVSAPGQLPPSFSRLLQ